MTKEIRKPMIRFLPDSNELGLVIFNSVEFNKEVAALIINESHNGVCLVINSKLFPLNFVITVDLELIVKTGSLDPANAKVRWIKTVDEELMKIGIEYV
jgi:hypothetical protein